MEQTLAILKALADLNRLRIVAALRRYDELCACEITELLQVTGATASRHLSLLQHAGLLESRKEGRWIHFRLAPPAETEAVIGWVETTCAGSAQFRSDAATLEKIAALGREDLCRMQRGAGCCPK